MTTYSEFLRRLGEVSIDGVVRRYGLGQTPPASLNAGELPASWLQLPEGAHEDYAFGGGLTWPEFHAQLIVATSPLAANTLADAFASLVGMMDAIRVALEGSVLAKSRTVMGMKQGVVTVAGIEYWAVVCNVTASG